MADPSPTFIWLQLLQPSLCDPVPLLVILLAFSLFYLSLSRLLLFSIPLICLFRLATANSWKINIKSIHLLFSAFFASVLFLFLLASALWTASFNFSILLYPLIPLAIISTRIKPFSLFSPACFSAVYLGNISIPIIALFCDRTNVAIVPTPLRVIGASNFSLYSSVLFYLLLLLSPRLTSKKTLSIALLTVLANLLIVGSRQYIIAMFAPPLILFVSFFAARLSRLKIHFYTVCALLAFSGLAILFVVFVHSFSHLVYSDYESQKLLSLLNLQATSNSDITRLSLLSSSFESISAHFLFGLGPGSAAQLGASSLTRDVDALSLHNTWLTILVEFGFVGLSLFVSSIACAFAGASFSFNSTKGFVAILSLLSCFTFSFFQDITAKPSLMVFVISVSSLLTLSASALPSRLIAFIGDSAPLAPSDHRLGD